MKIIFISSAVLLVPLTLFSEAKKSANEGSIEACGDAHVQFSARKSGKTAAVEPTSNRSTIYIFSKLNYGGIPLGCQVISRIGVDGKWVGANCGTSYLKTVISPGEHHLCSDWQSRVPFGTRPSPALLGFNVAAGKSYYFQATITYQSGIADLTLQPIDEDEGKNLLSSSASSESRVKP